MHCEVARVLRSCSKFGRIHEHNYNCKAITKVNNSGSLSNKFRNTQAWKKKRKIVFNRIKDYVSYVLETYMMHMDVYIITLLKYIT